MLSLSKKEKQTAYKITKNDSAAILSLLHENRDLPESNRGNVSGCIAGPF
jgi:hypothetical protein